METGKSGYTIKNGIRDVIYAFLAVFGFIVYGQNGLEPCDAHAIHLVFRYLINKITHVNGFTVFLIFICAYIFFRYAHKRVKLSKLGIIMGAFSSFFAVFGLNYELNSGMKFFSGKWVIVSVLLTVVALIGNYLVFAYLFELLWFSLKEGILSRVKERKISVWLFDKKPFLKISIVMLLFWIIPFIIYFPGIVQFDAMSALNFYYGNMRWTTHFPAFSEVFMGWLMDLGKLLGSDNIGCALYVVPQFFIYLLTLSYGFTFFKKWKTPYWIRTLWLVIICVCPVFSMYGIMEIKDTYSYVAYLWILYMFFKIKEEPKKKYYIIIAAMTFVYCSFRNDTKYVIVFTMLVLLIVNKRIFLKWKQVMASMASGLAIALAISALLCSVYNIAPGSKRETLSIFVQQTARYMVNHKDEITDEEWDMLDIAFPGRADSLDRQYMPTRSDSVKVCFQEEFGPEYYTYFKVWGKQFLKHPETYLSAYFNQYYGYFYIDCPEFYNPGFATKNYVLGSPNYYGDVNVKFLIKNPVLSRTHVYYTYFFIEMPIFKLMYHPASYVYVMIAALTLLLKNKKKSKLFFFSMPIGVLIICCLSPLNGSLRYTFPIVFSAFLLLAYAIKTVKEDKTN